MFASPPEQTIEWNDAGVEGAHRFLRRVWQFAVKHQAALLAGGPACESAEAKALRFELHTVLKQVGYDYERMQYNTVVSGAMKMLNALEAFKADAPATLREGFGLLLRVLYPACPHITCALWEELGYAKAHTSLWDAPWPTVDESALARDTVDLVLQVNGKLRGSLSVPADADRSRIEALAAASEEVARFSEGRPVRKIVVVPGRLVNVVV
jgi:leucyl-tRNA synthetase